MANYLDSSENFAHSVVLTKASDLDTTILLQNASKFPDPKLEGEYNLVWYDYKNFPDIVSDPNLEIVRVIEKNGNNLKIIRGQENTSPSPKNNSNGEYKVILTPTAKLIKDLNNVLTPKANISELISIDNKRPQVVKLLGYHRPYDGGGGLFYFDPDYDASKHDGGEVIYPNVTFPSDWSNESELDVWFKTGKPLQSDNVKGCWIRLNTDDYYHVEHFGLTPEIEGSSYILEYLWHLRNKRKIKFGTGVFKFNRPVSLMNEGVKIYGTESVPKNYLFHYNTINPKTLEKYTVLDFLNIPSTNTTPLISIGDGNIQVTNLGLYDLTILGNTPVSIPILKLKYVPQNGNLQNITVLQLGTGDGFHLRDVWVWSGIKDVYVMKPYEEEYPYNGIGFWITGESYAGGDIIISNLNSANFKIGIKIGEDPALGLLKDIRTIKLIACQANGATTGFLIGVGATQIDVESFWLEKIKEVGIHITGNARNIKLGSGRIAGLDLNSGGALVKLGSSTDEGVPSSTYKRASVLIENCHFHNLVNNTAGIVRYNKGINTGLTLINNIITRKNETGIDPSTIYGIWFKGEDPPSDSIVMINNNFGDDTSNASIDDQNRVVYGEPPVNASNLIKLEVPLLKEDNGYLYKFTLDNSQITNSTFKDLKSINKNILKLDWSSSTSAKWLNKNSNDFITITSVNGNNRAVYLPEVSISEGKTFVINRIDDTYKNKFVNIRTNPSDAVNPNTVIDRLYPDETVLLLNLDGKSWRKYKIKGIEHNAKEYKLSWFKDLDQVLTVIGSKKVTLVIDRNETINQDYIIPSNVHLKFIRESVISGPHTLTLNYCTLEAGIYKIFGSDITVTGTPKLHTIYPEWFGAVGNGTTDDLTPILKSINLAKSMGGGTVLFTRKVYAVSDVIDLADAPAVKLIGKGHGYNAPNTAPSIIKYIGTSDINKPLIHVRSTSSATKKTTNIVIKDLMLNCNSLVGLGLKITSINSSVFENISILNSTQRGLYTTCLNDKIGPDPADNQHNLFSNIYVKTSQGECIYVSGNAGNNAVVGANTSLNMFSNIHLDIRDNDGFVFEFSDGNMLNGLRVYRPATNSGRGLVFKADDTGANRHARNNVCYFVQTAVSGVVAEAGNGTQPSKDNTIFGFSLGNGAANNLPIIESGATLNYITDTASYGFGSGPAVFAYGSTPVQIQNNIKTQKGNLTNESIRVYNAAAKHITWVHPNSEWITRVKGTGDFEIYPVSNGNKFVVGAPLNVYNQNTVTTGVTGGSADALPANPSGYLEITINGNTHKIPYYN